MNRLLLIIAFLAFASVPLVIGNAVLNFGKGNTGHRFSPRNASSVAPSMAPAATAADFHAFF